MIKKTWAYTEFLFGEETIWKIVGTYKGTTFGEACT